MEHPTPPSPCDRPAKRQCWSSHDPENDSNLQSHHQQFANPVAIEFEASQHFVMVLFQLCNRAILKPTTLMGLDDSWFY
ncbi:unnamed protein product [Penicillium salamii]|uniref:Uncharacterized protein n=1 Tax=Penicillium salamii TaxID=1612424 RepID=A0A9W4NNU1_9EURO|nr:unnamed protein product [Penicillium salamii]CAG8146828.1 unnamed protein product [Penicillium salamii]CAG8155431.1 unnamed protein product [Penicillium salamii]CAG8373280.1 unnamed protein product [Penicillium salamii]CAG8376314.1 unnamed protein product [Penicillium salamii]